MINTIKSACWVTLALACTSLVTPLAYAKPNDKNKKVIEYWTPERISKAIPRHLVVDKKNGLGYIKRPDGSLIPHGHNKVTEISKLEASLKASPKRKPGGGSSDSTGPSISPIEPTEGETISASQRFAATITDSSGVRSATMIIIYPDGNTQNFSLANTSGDVWENTLSGFTDGEWSWRIQATDSSKGKGNSTIAGDWSFSVDTGSGSNGSGGSEDSVGNSGWSSGGLVQTAVGRLLYEMPKNARKKRWAAYVCSGSVVTDFVTGRSIIITAAHCVYDDANKAFARNVLFIPNQAQTSGTGTDSNCGNDPLGCWTPSFGIVDVSWTTSTFPNNIPWDYAYYVVNDSGAHAGTAVSSGALDVEAGSVDVDFIAPVNDDGTAGSATADFTYGLGYSYSDDPNFMYCADDMTTYDADNWWLPICGLSGGSSGGPWIQDMNVAAGDGSIISVNSWGFSDGSPGMAGPKLSGTTAMCIYNAAQSIIFADVSTSEGNEGVAVDYCN